LYIFNVYALAFPIQYNKYATSRKWHLNLAAGKYLGIRKADREKEEEGEAKE